MSAEMAYLGVAPCGCAFGVTVDSGRREDMAHTLGEWVADGGQIERVTVEQAKARFALAECPHDPKWGGMADDDERVFAGSFNREMTRIAQDAAWRVMNDDGNRLMTALLERCPDAPDEWWEDVGERVEQAFIDVLRVLPKPAEATAASHGREPS